MVPKITWTLLQIYLSSCDYILTMYVCCRRINPFDQSSGDDVVETLEAAKEDAHYIESFIVRFLGSMEVKADRGMVIYPA